MKWWHSVRYILVKTEIEKKEKPPNLMTYCQLNCLIHFDYLDKSSNGRYLKYFVICLKKTLAWILSNLIIQCNVVFSREIRFISDVHCIVFSSKEHVYLFYDYSLTVMVFTRYPVFTWKFLLFFSYQKKKYIYIYKIGPGK